MQITVHRIPWSTNVERIAMAASFKGVEVRWVDHDTGDRSALRELTGQDLVPVVEFEDGQVLFDSPLILARLEVLVPTPPLWPEDPARRAEADVFVQWFNHVWKVPPNAIDASRQSGSPDEAAIAGWKHELRDWLALFESLLSGRDHLLGDEFGIADVIAFPFLKFAVLGDSDDDDLFHGVLKEVIDLGGSFPRLRAWIERVDALQR